MLAGQHFHGKSTVLLRSFKAADKAARTGAGGIPTACAVQLDWCLYGHHLRRPCRSAENGHYAGSESHSYICIQADPAYARRARVLSRLAAELCALGPSFHHILTAVRAVPKAARSGAAINKCVDDGGKGLNFSFESMFRCSKAYSSAGPGETVTFRDGWR